MATVPVTVSDGLRVAGTSAYVTAHGVTMQELVVVAPKGAPRWRLGALLRSTVRVASTSATGSRVAVTLRAALALASTTRVGLGVTLRSKIAVRQTGVVALGVTLVERVRMTSAAARVATYRRAVRQALRVTSTLPAPALGAVLRAAFRVASSAEGLYRAVVNLAHRLEIHDVLALKLTITVVFRDAVLIRDATLLRSIYAGTLYDAVDFIVDTADPAGDTTTWAMNVRTGAVTEYLNYSFNSFAKSANGTYLGAGDDGLYELVGPDDAGTSVDADIISGLVDFSGSFLSGMQAAYLAVRGDGEFFLKLTEATGRSVTYGVKASSLKTSRINVGKGLRARFFTYELVSTGQDFDLLDLTFLPIQQTRRI